MAENCSKCGEVHVATGAICGGVNKRYRARVRSFGCRRWTLIGEPVQSYGFALQRMVEAFGEGGCHRADVIMWADYYDPVQLCELVRR